MLDTAAKVRKFHLTLICGVLFLLPLIWTPLSKESFRIPKESIFESVLWFLMLAWFINGLYTGAIRIRLTAPLLLFGGFFLVNAITVPMARNHDYALRDLFRLGGGVALYFYLISLIEEEAEVDWVCKMLIHGAVLMALLGILQYHGNVNAAGDAVGGWKLVPPPLRSLYAEDRPFSTSGNPIVLSEHVILIAPLVVHYLLSARSWAPKVFYFLLFVILGGSVFTSGTKAAWAGFAASLALYGLVYLVLKRKNILPWFRSADLKMGLLGGALVGAVLLARMSGLKGVEVYLWLLIGGLAVFAALVATPWGGILTKSAAMIGALLLVVFFYEGGPSARRPVLERLRTTTSVGTIRLAPPDEIYPDLMAEPPPGAGSSEKLKQKFYQKWAVFMATPSNQQRFMLWRITRLAAQEAPLFGVGLGNFCYYFTMKQGTFFEDPEHRHMVSLVQGLARQAHNEILQIWLENGLGGLALISLAFGGLFIVALVSVARTGNMLLAPMACGLIATVVEGQAQFCMHVSPTTYLILGMGALVDRMTLFNKPLLPAFSLKFPKLDVWALVLVIPFYFAWTVPSFYFWKAELGSYLTRRGETSLEEATKYEEARITWTNKLNDANQKNDTKTVEESQRNVETFLINREQKMDEAERWNFVGLSVEPENEELWFNLGLVYLRRASFSTDPAEEEMRFDLHTKARAAYSRTNQILDYGVARYNQAISYWATNEHEKAIESLKRAHFFDPFYGRTYQLLIDYLFRLHRFEEALAWLEKAKLAQPTPEDLQNLNNMEATLRQGMASPERVPWPPGYTPPQATGSPKVLSQR